MADHERTSGGETGVAGWLQSEMRADFPGASILLVEDDPDIRELMATLLRLAGYDPTVCSSAEMALEQLREQTFDLVLTDYSLPNRTGAWLLEQAQSEGLIEATPVLVVTAHSNPAGVADYEVIPKPFDLDDLVGRIKQRLEGPSRPRRATPSPRPGGPGGTGDGDCPEPVELILYVSTQSPQSLAAIADIRRVLERVEQSRVKLTICDLARNPSAGAADSIVVTPTLVKRSPPPRTYILGHVSNPDVLIEMIYSCGDEIS